MMHYEDAMTAVFSLELKSHRHVQPYRSKKDDRLKWATFEMWPMSVSPHPTFLAVSAWMSSVAHMWTQ